MTRDGFASMSVHRRLLHQIRGRWEPVKTAVGEFICTQCHTGFTHGFTRTVTCERVQVRQYLCPKCSSETQEVQQA